MYKVMLNGSLTTHAKQPFNVLQSSNQLSIQDSTYNVLPSVMYR